MSTLRINNIEAQSVPASPTIDEKVKVTNSSGDILVNIDGKTSGITTIGINTTDGNIKFDANSNVLITGILTATTLAADTFTPNSLEIGSNIKLGNAGVITATTFSGSGASLTNLNASNIASGTVPTARLGSGTANSSTFLAGDSTYKTVTGTTINNNADNRVITGSGTANTLEAESTLTFNGNTLNISGSSDDGRVSIVGHEGYDARLSLIADQGDDHIDQWNIRSKASNNTLTIDQFGGGTFNTRLTIASDNNSGNVTVNTGDLIIGTAGKGVDFPNSSLFESSVNMHLDIASGNNDFYIRSGGTTFAAFKGSAKDLQLTSGNLVIGTSGKGIDFSATADGTGSSQAEILDDYEEGSWSPTVSSGNASFSTLLGKYVKIGRQVTLWYRIASGGSYSGSSALAIQGIPFNNNTAMNPIGTSEFYKIDFARDYSDYCSCYLSGNTMRWLRNSSGGGSGNYLTINLFYSGAAITGMITYETDS